MQNDEPTPTENGDLPFGAMDLPPGYGSTSKLEGGGGEAGRRDWRRDEKRRGRSRRGGRNRNRNRPNDPRTPAGEGGDAAPQGAPEGAAAEQRPQAEAPAVQPDDGRAQRRRRRGRRGQRGASNVPLGEGRPARETAVVEEQELIEGLYLLEQSGNGVLRRRENQFLPSKNDVWVPQRFAQRYRLTDGALVKGPVVRGQGQYKLALDEVVEIDGRPAGELPKLVPFKTLTSIDPDFHYAVGDIEGDVSMRVLDVICPIGRGTRGLLVAPPRSGKTILMRKFASAVEKGYPDVKLLVLLVDERPEEATEWRRSTGGEVYVSTNDESAKNHVNLAEVVWKRCTRLVELGDDVILLLDSITRLARAYNNVGQGSGRTMSGGLDSRAMERPRAFFGSARNTETAGSLTILGTTLVDTGSRLDQLVFEEFKGTGNMECVLNRKLADRRIFPAIDVEKSGTRKEEKLISARRLKQIHTLRR
ncbi:MAG TPA: transcription termination factor Rho, partial [Planctomycetota bacterium]|nr:transcription termination factor Rho [Planctomycetota bacterium]